MRSTTLLWLSFVPIAFAACATGSPAARSPLREKLEKADTSDVVAATRDCLAKGGWKVDEVGSVSSTGADVVSATKDKDRTNVSIHEREYKPRITDGPDVTDPFWKCLGSTLGSPGAGGGGSGGGEETPAGSSSSGGEAPAHS